MGAERDRISLERFQHGVSLAKRALLMLSLRLEEGVVRLDLRDHRLIERLLRRPRTGRCERMSVSAPGRGPRPYHAYPDRSKELNVIETHRTCSMSLVASANSHCSVVWQ